MVSHTNPVNLEKKIKGHKSYSLERQSLGGWKKQNILKRVYWKNRKKMTEGEFIPFGAVPKDDKVRNQMINSFLKK